MPLDPYLKWLGIRDPERPPNHYALLGLRWGEDDGDVIANAADRQMAHVKTFQNGPHAEVSQRLLGELANARLTLLDPRRRRAYHQQVEAARAQTATTGPAGSPGAGDEAPRPAIVVEPLSTQAPGAGGAAGRSPGRRLALGAVVIGVGFAGWLAWSGGDWRSASRRPEGQRGGHTAGSGAAEVPQAAPHIAIRRPTGEDATPEPAAANGADAAPETTSSTDEPSPQTSNETPPPPTEVPTGAAAPLPALAPGPRLLESLAAALAQRRVEEARVLLETIRPALTSDELRARWARLRLIERELTVFWQQVRGGAESLAGAGQLPVGSELVTIEGLTASGIKLGRGNLTEEVAWRDLPGPILIALAEASPTSEPAARDRAVATFMAIDPSGDRAAAVARLTALRDSGQPVADLTEALALPVADSDATAPTGPTERLPLPTGDELAQAQRHYQDLYGPRITAATGSADRQALIVELLSAAENQPHPPAAYVMLVGAQALAVEQGSWPLARRCTDQLAQRFEVDPLAEATTALAEIASRALPGSASELWQAADPLLAELVEQDRWDELNRLNLAVNGLVRRAGDNELATLCQQRTEEWRRLQARYRRLAGSLATLAQQPDDPAAAAAVGRYRAFDLNRWDVGLPLLALGEDAELAQLARLDLDGPRTVDQQLRLADGWWDLAEKLPAPQRAHVRLRAADWYERARPWLVGLARSKAEARLEQAAAASSRLVATAAPAGPSGPEQLTVRLAEGLDLVLRRIAPGTYRYGDPRRGGEVTLTRPFYLAIAEVTQVQWRWLMPRNPSQLVHPGEPTRPVDNVSWNDAAEFLQALNQRRLAAQELPAQPLVFRLPTEAQWEVAARAGGRGNYCFGDDVAELEKFAWFYPTNSGGHTHPVASLAANAWGLFDVHGNVWEWCSDWNAPDQDGAAGVDPQGPAVGTHRILRGGSFGSSADQCRVWQRLAAEPQQANPQFGLRLAVELP